MLALLGKVTSYQKVGALAQKSQRLPTNFLAGTRKFLKLFLRPQKTIACAGLSTAGSHLKTGSMVESAYLETQLIPCLHSLVWVRLWPSKMRSSSHVALRRNNIIGKTRLNDTNQPACQEATICKESPLKELNLTCITTRQKEPWDRRRGLVSRWTMTQEL